MKIKSLQFMSPTALNFELTMVAPICMFHGEHSALVLDLVRELIGDFGAENDPDAYDEGRFVMQSDIEIDGKNYSVCYIRNADFMGDNRIAANFVPNSLDFSIDDTEEFIDKCNQRDKDANNVIYPNKIISISEDDRPLFVYCLDADEVSLVLAYLASLNRQAFVAVETSDLVCDTPNVQTFFVG